MEGDEASACLNTFLSKTAGTRFSSQSLCKGETKTQYIFDGAICALSLAISACFQLFENKSPGLEGTTHLNHVLIVSRELCFVMLERLTIEENQFQPTYLTWRSAAILHMRTHLTLPQDLHVVCLSTC